MKIRPFRRTPIMALVVSLSVVALLSGCSIPGSAAEGVGSAVRNLVNGFGGDGPDSGTGSGPVPTSDAGNTDMTAVAVGDCVNDADLFGSEGSDTPTTSPSASEDDGLVVASLDVVDCAIRHDSEVFGFVYYTSATIPSADELDSIADARCGSLFERYVGVRVEDSTLDYTWYTPTVEGWAEGDHQAMCELYLDSDDSSAQLTGTRKGSDS